MKLKISPRVALLIIASMFILPLVLAWLMYSGTIEYNPVNTRNLGSLVQPPVPLVLDEMEVLGGPSATLEELDEHWVMLYALPAPCGQACLEHAAALRQVHRASGRNQSRIRVLLTGSGDIRQSVQSLLEIYPSFSIAADNDGELLETLARVARDSGTEMEGSLYLLDPLGNIMLFYAAGFDPNDLKKDLKRLLTWSKLDES